MPLVPHLNDAQKQSVDQALDRIDLIVLELHTELQSLEVVGDGDTMARITQLRGLAQDINRQLFSLMQAIHHYWDHNYGPHTSVPPPPTKPTIEDLSI